MKKPSKTQSRIDSVDFSNLPFGKIFTDHMIVAKYSDKKWGEAELVPYGALELMPSISALHYGQTVFEGMKAFYSKKGELTVFRPDAHIKRLNKSLARLAMPELPENLFMESLNQLIATDGEWLKRAGTLYLRPFVFATDAYLGVKPSDEYLYMLLACPVGPYYTKPLNLKVETEYSRSAPGGVGFAKAAGNYAASMLPTKLAQEKGFDQLIWTDAATHTFIEECGTMNIACVMDGTFVTPALSETILSGITRNTALTVAQDMGMKVEEKKIKLTELLEGIEKGTVTEVFGLGTAATIIKFASITNGAKKYEIKDIGEKSFAVKLYNELDAIKRGEKKDTHSWMYTVKKA